MKRFLFVFITLLLLSCTKEEIAPIVEEEETVEEVSPFEEILGTWKVDFTVLNEDTTFLNNQTDIFYIEEDDDLADAFAKGYLQRANDPNRSNLLLELPSLEKDSIIIREGTITFFCSYTLHDDNHLEIDDSLSETQIWKTHYIR